MHKIICSDVFAALKNLPDNSVDIAITSPPYWGQRDYGFEGQIGNEELYEEYISKLVVIFSELRKILSKKGMFYLNIGDKYLNKYGKTPLALIPFQLAYQMIQDGWILNEILIWYKPNHMPSSIKNRFTNSYEPIFVFSKSKMNYFTLKKESNNNYSNILKINLQPTPYKHVAVFPEKLVEDLMKYNKLEKEMSVLDPFAGSGTTLKVIKDKYPTFKSIMIENSEEYIEIIKERCNLKNDYEIIKYNYIPYYLKKNEEINQLTLFENQSSYIDYLKTVQKKGCIRIFDKKIDYIEFLKLFINGKIRNQLDIDATCFIGCKEYDIELIYYTSQINNKGWVIRNLIVVKNEKYWFPIFMIVDDNKKSKYVFNYKKLTLKSKTEYNRNWEKEDFIGFNVIDSLSKNKNEGIIINMLERYQNEYPKYVYVKWNNNKVTKEFIINYQEEVNKNLDIYFNREKFHIKEKKELIPLNKYVNTTFNNLEIENKREKVTYKGKFKTEKRKNWGASPGARSSVEQEYFSVQRLYEVNQQIICDYLNHKRELKGLTKKELTDFFPKNYKHTVGHWLRKDFGGSLPCPEDWEKLTKILNIKDDITNYVCKTALKLQTVKNGEHKLPKDFIDSKSLDIFDKLIKI